MVRRIVLAVLVILALALLTVSFRSPTSGALHDMQGYGASALKPFQIAAERVARPFRDVYGYFSGLASAKSENAKLRRELRDVRATANSNLAGARQADELKRLLHYEGGANYPKDYRTVNTTVISYPSGASTQQVTIAAGSNSGIQIGTPIVTADGLLGHVTNVFPDTAQVMLLTDPDSSIPARDVTHGVAGIIRHGQGNTLILDRVSKAATVQKGDIIVTQGTVNPRYPDLYPYGIQIGSVLSANATDIASYYTVQVTPYARLDSLDAVAALISTKHR
jgi:rod shape-determining protein MreC